MPNYFIKQIMNSTRYYEVRMLEPRLDAESIRCFIGSYQECVEFMNIEFEKEVDEW